MLCKYHAKDSFGNHHNIIATQIFFKIHRLRHTGPNPSVLALYLTTRMEPSLLMETHPMMSGTLESIQTGSHQQRSKFITNSTSLRYRNTVRI
jgi:hypothetical protein